MLEILDACAAEIRSTIRGFTEGNLRFALNRALGRELPHEEFRRALRSRLRRGPIAGLLPSRCEWSPAPLGREWDAYFPKAILLVDRRPILDLFVASGSLPSARVAVVCIDGTPAHVVAWLRRGYRAGRRAPVLHLHDASTVIYPFAFEPLATYVRASGPDAVVFHDLGLPPNGCPASRYAPGPASEDRYFELEAVPPAALVAHSLRRAQRAVPGDVNMLPLARDLFPEGIEERGAR